MSSETKQALAEAIAAHVFDECEGSFTGAWVLVAETVSPDDDADRSSWHTAMEGSVIQKRGLLEYGLDVARWTGGDA